MAMTIGEMARRSGVTIRTLRHYDRIGLLHPCTVTQSGYRCYDEASLERLHTIRLFRELELPLSDIRRILDTPGFDPADALDMQITLLTMRREHLDRLIQLAQTLKTKGMTHMDFSAFDTRKIDDYTAQAKAAFGHTDAWTEYEQKENARHPGDSERYGRELMEILASFGQDDAADPASDRAQSLVQQLQMFISAHFYTCTIPILRGLADMYESDAFARNIDHAGGPGTAARAAQSIRIYCMQSRA